MKKAVLILIICFGLFSNTVLARDIEVKYRSAPVDVSQGFIEYDLARSTFVKELFYNSKLKYALVRLKSTFYHYCEMPKNLIVQ